MRIGSLCVGGLGDAGAVDGNDVPGCHSTYIWPEFSFFIRMKLSGECPRQFSRSRPVRYDDRREQYYHFPRTYFNQVRSAVGDCIIYYEPRRSEGGSGRQAYFATAKVEEVVPDPNLSDHFYAYLAGYLDFDAPVTFIEGGQYYESALRKDDGSTNKGAIWASGTYHP